MTVLAGVVSRGRSWRVSDSVCDHLKTALSRTSSDAPIDFRDAHAYLAKIDIGAFGCPAHRVSAAGSWTVLAGEPLLVGDGPLGSSRAADLEVLHDEWDRGDFRRLRNASGTFCAAHYDPRTGRLALIADRLGLRPLYYVVTDAFIFFSSALRILEGLPEVRKTVDVTAVTEIVGFGYPFGNGTGYAGIHVLRPCEIVSFDEGGEASSTYFRWDSVRPLELTEGVAIDLVFEKFQSAVRRRLRADRTTFSYLSGGLDSRCVVAALRAQGARVYTFNFSLPRTQDQLFGRDFAEKIGAIHHELPTEPGPNWSAVLAQEWSICVTQLDEMPERPALAWTGEGGSVGLGHVYLTPEIVDALRGGEWDRAIAFFLQQQRKAVLLGLLKPRVADHFRGHLEGRLQVELDEIRYPDPVRAFHIFLNLNGPRRHLVNHFETIDLHRLEFQLPFYDSDLLEAITALPIEPFLYHRLYVKWLSRFSPAVLAVPWQTYPGHVASPLPIPADLPDQWQAPASASHRLTVRNDLLRSSREMLTGNNFPGAVLRKSRVNALWWASKLRLGDYGYALSAALTYYRYAVVAEGRCALD